MRGRPSGSLAKPVESTRRKRKRSEPHALPPELEVRFAPGRGNGVYASTPLSAGWTWRDYPICLNGLLPAADAEGTDELMRELAEGSAAGDERRASLLDGPLRMSHVPRHLEMQDCVEEDLPPWALALQWDAARYNRLAAALQSNVARHAIGGGLVLNPSLRLANHSCDPNADICWDSCACGVGDYVVRARRPIRKGEEISYSYLGTGMLCGPAEREERRSILLRRWGFACTCTLCARQLAGARLRPRQEACRAPLLVAPGTVRL